MDFIRNPFKNPLIIKEDAVYILEREDVARIRNNVTQEVKNE